MHGGIDGKITQINETDFGQAFESPRDSLFSLVTDVQTEKLVHEAQVDTDTKRALIGAIGSPPKRTTTVKRSRTRGTKYQTQQFHNPNLDAQRKRQG